MIIDYTYFIGKINLPQTGNTMGRALVGGFIEVYEPEYLKGILGYDLWKVFTDGIAGPGEPEARFTALLDGVEFEYKGKTLKWEGLKAKPSPIANYIYYKISEDAAAYTTLVGTAAANTENAERVNPMPKMVDAWNVMIDLNILLFKYLYVNKLLYPEWDSYYHYKKNYKNSLDL